MKNMPKPIYDALTRIHRRLASLEDANLDARLRDTNGMIRRECGDREAQVEALVERCEALEQRMGSFFITNPGHQSTANVPITFDEGDVVSRKTGGPMMTVEKTRSDRFVACVWFDAQGHVQRDCFDPGTLNKWVPA